MTAPDALLARILDEGQARTRDEAVLAAEVRELRAWLWHVWDDGCTAGITWAMRMGRARPGEAVPDAPENPFPKKAL